MSRPSFGQAYFLVTGAADCRSSRRAVKAAAISGRSSRVSVAMVCFDIDFSPVHLLGPEEVREFLENVLTDHGLSSP